MTKPIGTVNMPTVDAAQLTPLKRAFLALEDAQSRLASMEQAAREPIAVIGLGCRVPGGATDSASFWRLMHDGVDAISPIPADRWDTNALYDPDPDTPGRIATRCGGFLHTIDQFDPSFFNISPREAMGIDPQQRLLLEVSWEALEHAGQAPDRLERSPTGVYMGVCSSDYTYLQLKTRDPALLDAHFTSGIAHSVISGRVSYVLGLQGPSMTIDTACSSSLVAVHLACNALRNGECRMALAGGVNLILAPDLFIALSHSRMLAPDGRCKTFDAAGDGFARGEGCGVIVLKRLSDAQADGDRILALIRGSAVNQDGPSSSLTAPNGPAQEAVIREALNRAGVAPREVGFVEAHGTGTQLGDPLEINALGAVFAADRDSARPLFIGSVKTNIGHLESAAGVAGIIKVILALQHRTIPPHLHFHTPNPHIAWTDLPLQVSAKEIAWEPIGGRRICGVSSFGFSGTNAHIILEEAPPCLAAEEAPVRRSCLLALSARDDDAFIELASRYADALEGRSDDELADVCHTANAGRAHFAHRATVIGRSIGELRTGLNALARGEDAMGVRTARITRRDPPRIAFLFTGQGAQYAGMSQDLYDVAPVFRAALDRCAKLLTSHLARPLLEVLFSAPGRPAPLDETAYTQPALFAVEYALTELWRSWGVTPNVVMGHSVGEYVAACVAGVLNLEDALRLIAKRGSLMQSLPSGGAMAAIFAPEERVAKAIVPHISRLSIAAVNGPAQTVISGDAAEVEAVCQHFVAQGIRCQPLPVSHAFHSPLMDPILDQFEREANAVRFAAPRMRLISNLTGRLAEISEVTRSGYWRRHVREAVRFGDGLRTLSTLRPEIVVEIGPNPTLLAFAGSAFDEVTPLLIPSLRKGRPDREQMLEGLAAIYRAGARIDWRGVGDGTSRQIVDLPTYPFQRQRYWFQAKSEAALPDLTSSRSPVDWYYEVLWQPQQLAGPRMRRAESGPWLVFADRGGIAELIAARRKASGLQTILVERGDRWLFNGDRAIIRPNAPTDYQRLLESIVNLTAILHLWTLDTAEASAPIDPMAEGLAVGVESLLHLLHGLPAAATPRPRIWLVTSGAQAVNSDDKCDAPWNAALWGLGKSLSVEHPELWGGLIDLTPDMTAEIGADLLVTEIYESTVEDKVAYRERQRFVARLAPWRPRPPRSEEFVARLDGTYVITGGLGGIGLAIARWLVERGARQLLLIGRTPLPVRETWIDLDPASGPGRRTAAISAIEFLARMSRRPQLTSQSKENWSAVWKPGARVARRGFVVFFTLPACCSYRRLRHRTSNCCVADLPERCLALGDCTRFSSMSRWTSLYCALLPPRCSTHLCWVDMRRATLFSTRWPTTDVRAAYRRSASIGGLGVKSAWPWSQRSVRTAAGRKVQVPFRPSRGLPHCASCLRGGHPGRRHADELARTCPRVSSICSRSIFAGNGRGPTPRRPEIRRDGGPARRLSSRRIRIARTSGDPSDGCRNACC